MTTQEARDVELARALLPGDLSAFDEFVETFRQRIFQYSHLMCGQREDAEEVAQDTLLKLFENFHTLRSPERVRPWVFRIAKNACLMKRRRSIFAPEQEVSLEQYMNLETEDGLRPREVAAPDPEPEARLLQRQLTESLERAIQALPPSYRSVILLRDMEELSTEDAAEILEVSTDVVKQRLHRARLALRRILEDQLHPPHRREQPREFDQ